MSSFLVCKGSFTNLVHTNVYPVSHRDLNDNLHKPNNPQLLLIGSGPLKAYIRLYGAIWGPHAGARMSVAILAQAMLVQKDVMGRVWKGGL